MTDAILRRFRPDQIREVVLLLVVVGMIVFFSTQIEGYLSGRTFNRITTAFPIVAVMVVGQVLVVLTRNIDLSIGSQAGLIAYTLGSLIGNQPDLNPLLLIAMGLGMGAILGGINGAVVAYGRVPAIITTLATLAIYRVILIEVSDARTVTTAGFPAWMLEFPSATLVQVGGLDIRLVFAITLLTVAIGQLVLRYLPYGRRLYAIGSNPDAAQNVGLPAQRDVFWAFVGCGALAGLGGFLFLAKFGNLTVEAGSGLELQVVAAVVVGGVNIFGGSGSMIGAFLGAVLVETLQQSLVRWIGVSDFLRDFLLGALILVAVATDKIVVGRLQDAWVRVRRRDEAAARAAREAGR
ncbi:MAG TPA: ABC transporter permease [Candidatus Limnocylindrales bacterium]|nr:ABC transporter permease [Candidatus Limnocylindrales bacterium]